MSLTIYIIAINGGHVVEADNAGKEIKTQKATVSKSQQWVVEWKGAGKSDEFALRNVATDAYLGAPKGVSGTYCTTNAKQFWRAEPGHAPGSFWLKSLEFDDACLCNSGAKTTANSIVYMWKKDV
ncbi:uncharacterized protein J4E88_007977 [Alternaria novae-zelandiae]|uniref:uncharacterized protein n=1 Tax=Alternaria novae-zelandiae TaxID=430562 RepID=UPI0020C41068|nr:uncharacterized protein J4E88_007977 [Alternaria novae-zelandiae]KAI4675073.1 hypothetical protein J4E88_007977 [Alternaria novae-zelandiae]